MTDTFRRLKSALSDRYAIEKELGASGIAFLSRLIVAARLSVSKLTFDNVALAIDQPSRGFTRGKNREGRQ